MDEITDLELPEASVFTMPFPFENGYDTLLNSTQWSQTTRVMYGREVKTPRLTAWYGDPGCTYTYSTIKNDPLPWNDVLLDLRHRVGNLFQTDFNSVLLNLYRDGQDSIDFHADDEKELGTEPVIASLSFGAPRTFVFRHRTKQYRDVEIPLEDQTLLLMMGPTQQNWLHGIPKVNNAGPRINLTFRTILVR